MVRLLVITALIACLSLAACGDDDDPEGSEDPAAAAHTDPSTTGGGRAERRVEQGSGGSGREAGAAGDVKGITIATGESQFGEILFDGDDRAIYLFEKERGPTSECYGDCAVAWPPVLTEGAPKAAGGASAKLLGTTARDDGTTQVTYDGQPLYYYVDDPPGEVLCQNVDEFGGLWLVVEPTGAAVR